MYTAALTNTIITLLAAVCTVGLAHGIHTLLYPRIRGPLVVAGHEFDYKVGKVPLFTAGKVYLRLYRQWWVVTAAEYLRWMAVFSGSSLTIETKTLRGHVLDCGLVYPAIYGYFWFGIWYVLTHTQLGGGLS